MSSRAESTTPTSSTSRGSYPSRQRRFGPAPLASFEDLPTDEAQSSSEDERASAVAVRMACPQISLVITDHNEVEHPIETVQLPFRRLDVQQSFNSPGKVENKRKGSWTDIFSMRKSPSPTRARERKFSLFNFNFFTKESPRKLSADARADCELQSLVISQQPTSQPDYLSNSVTHEIGVQVGNFDEIKAAFEETQAANAQEYDLTPTNVDPPSLSLLETVVHVELHQASSVEVEEDNQTIVDSTSLCSASSCSCRSLDRGSETEPDAPCAECERERSEKILPCSCDELDTDAADNEDNDEETEQENEGNLARDVDELESLLTGDELEQNAALNSTEQLVIPRVPVLCCLPEDGNLKANCFKLSTEKLKTSPIERPHSITPVNMSSFEAYIKCPPAENISDGDRLTIKIPGLHPNQRNRFTRKSNPYIWADFCEKGLKSPKIESMARKRANSCFPEINQNCYLNEAFSPSDNLTPITPIKDLDGAEDRFDDNFWDYLNRNNKALSEAIESETDSAVKAALKNLQKLQSSCSCDCNSSVTSTGYNFATSMATCSEMSSYSESSDNNDPNESISISVPEITSPRTEYHEDQPLVSPCDCVCHHGGGQPRSLNLSTSLDTNGHLEALYDSRNTEDDLSQLSSSTLSSTSSTATSTSLSVRLLDTSAASNV